MSEAKSDLRRLVRERRAAWPAEARREASALLCRQVVDRRRLDGTVMAYLAFGSEADVADVIDAARRAGGRVVVPRVENRRIVPVELTDDTALVVSNYGIREPAGPPIDPAEISLVLVPGVAFDREGRRLGNGAGYYDRFLPTLRPDAVTIGVCLSVQIVDEVPSDPWDVRVGLVMSERGVEGGTRSSTRGPSDPFSG